MTPVNLQNGVRHVTAERSEDEIRTFESAGAQRRARQKYETEPKSIKFTGGGRENILQPTQQVSHGISLHCA